MDPQTIAIIAGCPRARVELSVTPGSMGGISHGAPALAWSSPWLLETDRAALSVPPRSRGALY